ncbi:MAG: DNA repair protein RadC [Rikenellaceae bacterium]
MDTIDKKRLITDKIKFGGVATLNDSELLTIALNLTNSQLEPPQSLPTQLLSVSGGDLTPIFSASYSALIKIYGLSPKNAAQILSIAQIARRVKISSDSSIETIKNSSDIAELFHNQFTTSLGEEFWVVYLNNGNRIIEKRKASDGQSMAVAVDVKLIIRHALNILASKIIVVHNHPSNDTTPSSEDIEITNKLEKAAAYFDIKLLDHLIISNNGESYYSFSDN